MSRKIQVGDKVVFSDGARTVDSPWYTEVRKQGAVGVVTQVGSSVAVGWFLGDFSNLRFDVYWYSARELKVLDEFDLDGFESYLDFYKSFENLPPTPDS